MATRELYPNHVQYREPEPSPTGLNPRLALARCFAPALDDEPGPDDLPEGSCACGAWYAGEMPCPTPAGRPACVR